MSPSPTLSLRLRLARVWSRLTRLRGPMAFFVASLGALGASSWIWAPVTTRSGLLINLATELIGIAFTVFVVDQLLEMHERERWAGLDTHIGAHLRNTVRGRLTDIRTMLGLPHDRFIAIDVMDESGDWERDYFAIVASDVEPRVRSATRSLSGEMWERIMKAVRGASDDMDQAMLKFSHRLSPHRQKAMLEIQDAAHRTLVPFVLAPVYFGVGTFEHTARHEAQAADLRRRSAENLEELAKRLREFGESTFEAE